MTGYPVEARFKKRPTGGEHFDHFVISCNRQSPPCEYPLGRVYSLTCLQREDPRNSESYVGYQGHANWAPGLAGIDLTLGMRNLDRATIIELPGSGWSPPCYRIWVACHEIGYRERDDGDFELLTRKSPTRNPWRMAKNGRARGTKPLPSDLADALRDRIVVDDGEGAGLAPDGYGIVGANPALPAIIRCPKCSGNTRNLILPLAFDERFGTWYTVRTEWPTTPTIA